MESLQESMHANAIVETGLITREQGWGVPDWMDKSKVQAALEKQQAEGVQYGGIESYRTSIWLGKRLEFRIPKGPHRICFNCL